MNLLSITFNFGDLFYSSGYNSGFLDWLKFGVPVLLAILTLFFQKWLDKKREQKKQILKLYNLNQSIKHIINEAPELVKIFTDYSAVVKASPLSENVIKRNKIIPDFVRVLDINKDDIFSAFLLKYKDNSEAADDYRKLYNSIEFYKQTHELLYTKYFTLSEETYKKKMNLRDRIELIDINSKNLLRKIKYSKETVESIAAFTDLNNLIVSFQQAKEALGQTTEIWVNHFMEPLVDVLIKHAGYNTEMLDLNIETIKALHLSDYIKHDADQMADFLKGNAEEIPKCVKELSELSGKLDARLTETIAPKTGWRYKLDNYLDIYYWQNPKSL